MPRIVDHHQRRTQIAHAFQQLMARDGFAGTSLARVAAEAGVSVGLIQHYFDSKEELLQFAHEDSLRQVEARARGHVDAGEAAGLPISAILRSALAELLPLDTARAREFRVRQSLLAQATTDERLAGVARAGHRHLRSLIATAVHNGKECGEVEREVHVAAAASMILATVTGLAQEISLHGDLSAVDAPADASVLEPVIGSVFTGRCRRHG